MNSSIRIVIFKKKYVYDDIIATAEHVCKYKKDSIEKQTELQKNKIYADCTKHKLCPILINKKGLNATLVSVYIFTMNRSNIYRKSAVAVLTQIIESKINSAYPVILVRLRTPKNQYLDYRWNERLSQMVMERQEIDHAMSWLSTLGGAFSALGDQFDHCAEVAGKISIEQFKLAIRLGDPQLVARCNLYAALSLIQQGHLKISRYMVKKIFKFSTEIKDVRLQNMCQGVWAKLKYCYSQRKKLKMLPNKLD